MFPSPMQDIARFTTLAHYNNNNYNNMSASKSLPLPPSPNFLPDSQTPLLAAVEPKETMAEEEVGGHAQQPRSLLFHARTIFLFTKSDLKTVVFPQTVCAVAAALSAGIPAPAIAWRLPLLVLWIWLLLLVECVSNQRQPGSIEEDAINKAWRPFPSKRMHPQAALAILRLAIPLTAAVAYALCAFTPTVAFFVLVWLYNDLEGSEVGPASKNLLNAGGLGCWGWGGLAVLSRGGALIDAAAADKLSVWIIITTAVVATTIQAQDIPDVEGDGARGRKTMPLLYGQAVTRWTLAPLVLFWTVASPLFCNVTAYPVWALLLALGGAMAGLTVSSWKESSDKIVWTLWCLWIAVIYSLPFFGHLDGR